MSDAQSLPSTNAAAGRKIASSDIYNMQRDTCSRGQKELHCAKSRITRCSMSWTQWWHNRETASCLSTKVVIKLTLSQQYPRYLSSRKGDKLILFLIHILKKRVVPLFSKQVLKITIKIVFIAKCCKKSVWKIDIYFSTDLCLLCVSNWRWNRGNWEIGNRKDCSIAVRSKLARHYRLLLSCCVIFSPAVQLCSRRHPAYCWWKTVWFACL